MRTIIDIPDEQLQQLAKFCNREALSRSEAIRRAIAGLIKQHVAEPGEAFGLWKGRDIEGVSNQQSLRREWD